jgi:hypothetical protein
MCQTNGRSLVDLIEYISRQKYSPADANSPGPGQTGEVEHAHISSYCCANEFENNSGSLAGFQKPRQAGNTLSKSAIATDCIDFEQHSINRKSMARVENSAICSHSHFLNSSND